MNPKGVWIFKNLELWFVNTDIMAIYGKVFPIVIPKRVNTWYWEARTILDARISDNEFPCGYADSEEGAKRIVETILKETGSCLFDEKAVG
jgi:hypothetical protein